MFDKIMQGALIFKAKITKDQVQGLLLEATSEDNWQTPTTILHEIANAAYNYEEWQRISNFIWQKLKLKKWKKVLKTLNLIQFLLKNGPASILSSFKYQVYIFKSFDSYVQYEQGIDKGEAIRAKAKTIVQLLNNQQLLEQQRVKAKNIRERLANSVGSQAYGGKSGSYGGTRYKNQGSGKYEGMGSGSSDNYSSKNTYNSYQDGSSINKYKQQMGKSNSSKDNEQKKIAEILNNSNQSPLKKPFQKAPPKLEKPGQIKKKEISIKQMTKNQNATKIKTEPIDIFQFDEKPVSKPSKQQKTPVLELFDPPVINPVQQSKNQLKPNIQMPYQNSNQFNQLIFPNNNNLSSNQFINPINNNQINYNAAFNPNLLGGIYPNNQAVNQMNNQFNQLPPEKKNNPINNQYTYNTKTSSPSQIKQQQQFGGFQSSNKQNIKWLSKQQTNLIDFSDFGKQIKQKQKPQPVEKKQSQSILLIGDLDNLMNESYNKPNIYQNNSNLPQQPFNNYSNINTNYQYGYQGYVPTNQINQQQQYFFGAQQPQQQKRF